MPRAASASRVPFGTVAVVFLAHWQPVFPFLDCIPEKFVPIRTIAVDLKIPVRKAGSVMGVLRRVGLVEREIIYANKQTVGRWRKIRDRKEYWNIITKLRKTHKYSHGGKN